MFNWLRKKQDDVIFIESVKEFTGKEDASRFSEFSWGRLDEVFKGFHVQENPEKPDWYENKWEICISGKSLGKYAIKCNGRYVRESFLNYCGSGYSPATFLSIDDARFAMYSLIRYDIEKQDSARRKDETVETWP